MDSSRLCVYPGYVMMTTAHSSQIYTASPTNLSRLCKIWLWRKLLVDGGKKKTTNDYLRICQSLDTWLVCSTSYRPLSSPISSLVIPHNPKWICPKGSRTVIKRGKRFLLLSGGRRNRASAFKRSWVFCLLFFFKAQLCTWFTDHTHFLVLVMSTDRWLRDSWWWCHHLLTRDSCRWSPFCCLLWIKPLPPMGSANRPIVPSSSPTVVGR